MSNETIVLILIVVVAILAIVAVVTLYNVLIKAKNECLNNWSLVDVQLQRRYDLIPNLVETVKGYTKHEADTLIKVTQARNMSTPPSQSDTPGTARDAISESIQRDNFLTSTLKSLFAVTEAYPELKADQNFLKLQEDLTAIENAVATSRSLYNGSVLKNNNLVNVFPNNIVAGIFKFVMFDYFELNETDRETMQKTVKVEF